MNDVRVTAVTVGDKLDQERSLVRVDPLLRKLGRLVDGNDVHTVHLDTRDEITTGVVLRVRRAALCRGTHSVFVVFANEDARKVP